MSVQVEECVLSTPTYLGSRHPVLFYLALQEFLIYKMFLLKLLGDWSDHSSAAPGPNSIKS